MEILTLKKRNNFKNFVKKQNNITVTATVLGKPGCGKTISTKERARMPFFEYMY